MNETKLERQNHLIYRCTRPLSLRPNLGTEHIKHIRDRNERNRHKPKHTPKFRNMAVANSGKQPAKTLRRNVFAATALAATVWNVSMR